MDDVEGGTRLSGDALSGRVDASKNRIPNGNCIKGQEFWEGRVVLQSVGHGITGGWPHFSNALKYLFDRWWGSLVENAEKFHSPDLPPRTSPPSKLDLEPQGQHRRERHARDGKTDLPLSIKRRK